MRYPRGQGPGVAPVAEMTALPVGKAQTRRMGSSGLLILAFGALVKSAEIIGERLDATVVNMRFVKPLDEELVLRFAATHTRAGDHRGKLGGGRRRLRGDRVARQLRRSRCPRSRSAFPTGSSNTARAKTAWWPRSSIWAAWKPRSGASGNMFRCRRLSRAGHKTRLSAPWRPDFPPVTPYEGLIGARKPANCRPYENRRCTPGPRHLRRGRPEPRRHPPDPDQPGRHQGHQSSGARQGSLRGTISTRSRTSTCT